MTNDQAPMTNISSRELLAWVFLAMLGSVTVAVEEIRVMVLKARHAQEQATLLEDLNAAKLELDVLRRSLYVLPDPELSLPPELKRELEA